MIIKPIKFSCQLPKGIIKNIAGDICNDLENLVNRKSQLPDSPTVESARIVKIQSLFNSPTE